MSNAFDSSAFLKTVSRRPGVYQMFNQSDEIIYVGKAGDLKARLSSYFHLAASKSKKTAALVSHIAKIETLIAGSEAEALIVEQNLIKKHRPRYNILLRDDKSYPYVFVSTGQQYPRLSYQRGGRRLAGKYIGPFPNAGAVKATLRFIQKLFAVRQCDDSYFANRSRPCLQYQIKRCSAPCVQLISPEDYSEDVMRSIKLLEGKNVEVIHELVNHMEVASKALRFEKAASLRDQISDLKKVSNTAMAESGRGKQDFVACSLQGGTSCIQVFFLRNGMNLGNKSFYPATPEGSTADEVLYAFITQFYLQHEVPREIIVSHEFAELALVEKALSEKAAQKIKILTAVRGERARLQALAQTNAEVALGVYLSSRSGLAARYNSLAKLLELEDLPQRMECFDISHTSGELTVASCVVFNPEGPLKAEYRRFNIEGITPGDDYAAMEQALQRRYTRMLKENSKMPDVLFIDGGAGQVARAIAVMQELQLTDIRIVGVAKGPDRRAGDETLLLVHSGVEKQVASDTPGLHLIQQIRDESHRFAITGHRARRASARNRSVMEDVKGLGPKRRKTLLTHFGGMQGIKKASVEELSRVPGISKDLAAELFEYLHPSGINT